MSGLRCELCGFDYTNPLTGPDTGSSTAGPRAHIPGGVECLQRQNDRLREQAKEMIHHLHRAMSLADLMIRGGR